VADWDLDGLLDIITGESNGYFTLFQNLGNPTSALHDTGERFWYNGEEIHYPHNVHPKIYDINQDGFPDLTYGINWGTVGVFINNSIPDDVYLDSFYRMLNSVGEYVNVRSLITDNTNPEFVDLNNDQILDMLCGGESGEIYILYGISYANILNDIDYIMASDPNNIGQNLANDVNLKNKLFKLHQGIRTYVHNHLTISSSKQLITDWYLEHVIDYSQYFLKQYLDTSIHPYIPSLAGQIWVNLFESQADTPAHRLIVANAINLQGQHRNIYLDHGVLFIENSTSDINQQDVIYNYLNSLPKDLWSAKYITIRSFLGDYFAIQADMGVNIFGTNVGQSIDNTFPSDSVPGYIDTYSSALAHEINHTVDAYTFGKNRNLLKRKYSLIEQAASPDVIYYSQEVALGVDWTSTKTWYQSQGYWNGAEDDWNQAWSDYWSTGPGVAANENWLRNNLKLMCEAPQEAFATLANQYFTNSRTMLNLSLSRWDRGITTCINQFLFFVDVYSQGNPTSFFYIIDTNGNITRDAVGMERNSLGYINRLCFDESYYEFFLDDQGDVTGYSGPIPHESLIADIIPDCHVNVLDFSALSSDWLKVDCNDCNQTDLNEDNVINHLDAIILTESWLGQPSIEIYSNYLDTNPNWIVTGEWEFGQPTGGGGEHVPVVVGGLVVTFDHHLTRPHHCWQLFFR